MRCEDNWFGGRVDYGDLALSNIDDLGGGPVMTVESLYKDCLVFSAVSISIDSPGRIILFVFIDIKLYLLLGKVLWLVTGNVASSVVAGTVFLLCKSDIVLLVKS